MTREVFVKIEGNQADLSQESMAVNVPGIYHLKNGKHYIQFDETTEDGNGLIKNTLKISGDQVEIKKKGALISRMNFHRQEETTANYQTPYGNLIFQIHTHLLTVEETAQDIMVNLNYTLFMEESHISENRIQIIIKPIV